MSAYEMASGRLMAESLTGARISSSGARAPQLTSNRTWSLPLPVQPWATADAPLRRASSTRSWAISGRDRAETSG